MDEVATELNTPEDQSPGSSQTQETGAENTNPENIPSNEMVKGNDLGNYPQSPANIDQNPENIDTNSQLQQDPIPEIRIPPETVRINSPSPRHFYPSPPMTARSSRFVRSRPGTARTLPYTNRKISSYATPLVQLRASYHLMDIQLHSFVANCNIEAISPDLLVIYKSVDKAYDIFCTQANQLLSSQDPKAAPRDQLTTSAISKISEDLVNKWVLFIKTLNKTTSQGSVPGLQIISGRLSKIFGMFRDFNCRFKAGMMRSSLSSDGMRRVDGEIILLRRECNEKFRNGELLDKEFADKIKRTILKVETVFSGSTIKATMCTAEIMRMKSELKVETSDLMTNVNSMLEFEASAGKTRAEIAKVNEVLNYLFQLMHLPYELKIKYEDEMTDEEKKAEKADDMKDKKKPSDNQIVKICMFENMVQ